MLPPIHEIHAKPPRPEPATLLEDPTANLEEQAVRNSEIAAYQEGVARHALWIHYSALDAKATWMLREALHM